MLQSTFFRKLCEIETYRLDEISEFERMSKKMKQFNTITSVQMDLVCMLELYQAELAIAITQRSLKIYNKNHGKRDLINYLVKET